MRTLSLENILIGNSFAALEFFSDSSGDKIAFCEIRKVKDELVINRKELYESIDALLKDSIKTPSILIINTNKVLMKETDTSESNERKNLHKTFPNLKTDEFYYEVWKQNNSVTVAVSRRSYIDDVVASLKGMNLAGIYLGLCSLSNFDGLEIPNEMHTNTHIIKTESSGNIILEMGPVHPDNEFIVNRLALKGTHITCLAGLLHFLIGKKTQGNINELDIDLKEGTLQNMMFRKATAVFVLTLLILLLINFFAFSYYFDRVEEGKSLSITNKSTDESIKKLQKGIRQKEEQLHNFEINQNQPASVIINNIAKNIPGSISLDEFTLYPLEKKIKKEEVINIRENFIVIRGVSSNNLAFTQWVSQLQKLPSVNDVRIVSYGKADKEGTDFYITIALKDEA